MSEENINSSNMVESRDSVDSSDIIRPSRRLSVDLEISDKKVKTNEKRRKSISVLLLGKKQNKVSSLSNNFQCLKSRKIPMNIIKKINTCQIG